MSLSSINANLPVINRANASRATLDARPTLSTDMPVQPPLVAGSDDDFGAYAPGKTSIPQDSFTTAAPNAYVKFMPTREGFSSNNLALAVTDPAAEPFSAGKTKEQVTQAAREAIDTRLGQMRESGQAFSVNSFEGADWYSAFGDLDRRALSAVATDKTGLFSDEEKGIARSIMGQQQGLAMGLYSGPTRLAGEFGMGNAGDNMAIGKAGALWLDKVSLDEKSASFEWAEQRAATERLYRSGAEEAGQTPQDLSSGFSFVEMLLKAYKDLGDLGPPHEIGDVPAYGKAKDLFATWAQSTQASLAAAATSATSSSSASYYI